MTRRERTARVRCTFPGCAEIGWFAYASERERATLPFKTWRCTRHTNDGHDVLTEPDVPMGTTLVLVEESYGKFWREEGKTSGGSGFVRGPGFKLFAADWPTGTRVAVTAVASLPEPAPSATVAVGDEDQ